MKKILLNSMKKVLEIDPNLKKNFRRVEIGISNKRLALVPGKIFNEGDSQHYLENSAQSGLLSNHGGYDRTIRNKGCICFSTFYIVTI